jgi:hypothetical protein
MLAGLPDPAELISNTELASATDDLFICALGFEDRCAGIPSHLASVGYHTQSALVLRYSTNIEANDTNYPLLTSKLEQIAERTLFEQSDEVGFTSRLRAIIDNLQKSTGRRIPSVTFDISVSANRIILPVIKILMEHDISLRIVYAEAQNYYPTRAEFEDQRRLMALTHQDWFGLEMGVSNVMKDPEHLGQHLDPLPDSVILFPSFKAERSKAVINFVDPSLSLLRPPTVRLQWIIGKPPLAENQWRINAMREINGLTAGDRQREVSTFYYKETIRELEIIYEDIGQDHNVTISPLGSKLQAVGITLFCYLHPDVRVVFAVPDLYNAAYYSTGCPRMWSLEFGRVQLIRERLDKVGKLLIED